MDAGLYRYEHRNHCPWCLHSRHVMFGTSRLPPCDGLMRPDTEHLDARKLLIQQCDCGFRWAAYDEDWWAALTPGTQTGVINAAYTETERLNGAPTIIYRARPLYATRPPRIPAGLLGTRTRAVRRP
jgi:RNHCP domain